MMHRLIALALFLGALLAIIFFYLYWEESQNKSELTLFGNVDVRQVDISFRVGGRVVNMPFEEGDFIPASTLVAELDNQPYLDELRRAEASVISTQASLDYAEKVLKRRQELIGIGDGSISREDYENALSSRDVLKANLKETIARLGIAETNLHDTSVYAPSDGVILTRIREPGSVVREADPIYTLSLTNPIWVRAYIREPFLGKVNPGMKASVFTDSSEGKSYKGHVGFISPVAEFTPKSVETTDLRTDLVYRLRIIVENPDWGLKQGMPVTVKLHFESENEKPADHSNGSIPSPD